MVPIAVSSSRPDPAPLDAAAIVAALRRLKLVEPNAEVRAAPLPGGVSSDIWLVELGTRRLCVKRALPRLKVAQLWEAPVERNRYEWDWLETVARFLPDAVPPLVARDEVGNLFVMEYLEPAHHPVWKELLRRGEADTNVAAEVGRRLATIHRSTAGDARLRRQFATDAAFYAIRLEPYLIATGNAHPDLAPILQSLAETCATTRLCLVHGDVSPKNILIGPRGPIFLDAECAWYGDPTFDLAFCLKHLLLKCLWTPRAAAGFLACYDALVGHYLEGVAWEGRATLEARAARLLPGLFLARVDGKSPVEYVTDENQKNRVRRVAREFLLAPSDRLSAIRARWAQEIGL
ncbi:MAG TPA: aminoglycoside phosphotransferase family protein [Alphaproteobacteria bacterium]|nr:aminoglycoside phosphotransferase family protein [Alphaproteobacteria bacterium]